MARDENPYEPSLHARPARRFPIFRFLIGGLLWTIVGCYLALNFIESMIEPSAVDVLAGGAELRTFSLPVVVVVPMLLVWTVGWFLIWYFMKPRTSSDA